MIVLFMSGVFVLIVELTFVKYDHCGILSQKGGGVTWHLRPKLNGLKQPETL